MKERCPSNTAVIKGISEAFLAMPQKIIAGVDIGGTKMAVVLSSAPPQVFARVAFPTRTEWKPECVIAEIIRTLKELLEKHGLTYSDIEAIGVSCGSPLDPVRGIIQTPPNLPTWVDVPICELLTNEFHAPCYLENDANAGALAEFHFGAGRATRNFIFLTMGTGLGAGFVLDGRLYRGTTYSAGEVGHVRLTPTGPLGYGKHGSVEGWASGGGIGLLAEERVREAIAHGVGTKLAAVLQTHSRVTAKDVADAMAAGDALATELMGIAGEKLGETIAILVDLLNPECVAIGGLALRLGDTVLAPARAVVQRECLPPSAAACRIIPAQLGESIGDVAALCIALEGKRQASSA